MFKFDPEMNGAALGFRDSNCGGHFGMYKGQDRHAINYEGVARYPKEDRTERNGPAEIRSIMVPLGYVAKLYDKPVSNDDSVRVVEGTGPIDARGIMYCRNLDEQVPLQRLVVVTRGTIGIGVTGHWVEVAPVSANEIEHSATKVFGDSL